MRDWNERTSARAQYVAEALLAGLAVIPRCLPRAALVRSAAMTERLAVIFGSVVVGMCLWFAAMAILVAVLA
jgi:hypothetical protein